MNKKIYKLKSIIRKIFIKTKYLLIAAAKKGIKYLIRKQFIDSDNKKQQKHIIQILYWQTVQKKYNNIFPIKNKIIMQIVLFSMKQKYK